MIRQEVNRLKRYYIENEISLLKDYKYNIYNESMELIYTAAENGLLGFFDRFWGSIAGIGHRILIKDSSGNELFSIKKHWTLFKRDFDIAFTDKACVTEMKGHALMKPEITITSPSGKYIIIGDVMARDFTIRKDQDTVSTIKVMSNKFLKQYEIMVLEDNLDKIAIAAAFIIDNAYHS